MTPPRGPMAYFRGAARGLLDVGQWVGKALLVAALIAAASAAVAAPAWLLASRRPRLFTAFALALVGAVVGALLVFRIRREARRAGGLAAWARERLLPAAGGLLLGVASALALFGTAFLFAAGLYGAAIPAAAACALVIGRRAYRLSRRRRGAEVPRGADDIGDADRR